MKNVLILDVETTISNNGNPFDQNNKLVCIGVKRTGKKLIDRVILYNDFNLLQKTINLSDLIVLFNAKFDLHWLRKIGIDISNIRVWDCQLAEFILNNQKTPYPSLNDAAVKYGYPPKIDIVKNEYWDKGINTNEIPREILSEYLQQDLVLTQQVYERQLEQFKTNRKDSFALFKLQCADLLVLEEMEWNGIKFDTAKALKRAEEIEVELDGLYNKLSSKINSVPINLNSNDHVSVLLYGGIIVECIRIPIGVYKTGEKAGQPRYKLIDKEYILPRLVEPLKGTEVKKGGYWEVNETILRKLKLSKEAREIVKMLTRYSELEKLRGTYLVGYSKLIEKMNWSKDVLHGMLNQCVAITGRLSSSKPNLQNVDPITKVFMETQY